jgi:hypothetical protein
MREQQNNQRTESQTLTSQSQAMLNLNMKLQSTVLKGHVKTIDLELRKLDAVQAIDRLDIIKPYLPSSFFEADMDAVDALLFFERLSYKAGMLWSMIDQIHNISDSLDTVVSESLVVFCEVDLKQISLCVHALIFLSLFHPPSIDTSQTRHIFGPHQAVCGKLAQMLAGDVHKDGPVVQRARGDREESGRVRRRSPARRTARGRVWA